MLVKTMDMLPEHQEAFDRILECFSGADGCVSFVNVKMVIEEMDRRAHDCTNREGNNSYEVLHCMRQFGKLIEFANRKPEEEDVEEDHSR
jgi:hypothetical protein